MHMDLRGTGGFAQEFVGLAAGFVGTLCRQHLGVGGAGGAVAAEG